jgi:nuclear transport factor 2 (NTF2) superfamily protein
VERLDQLHSCAGRRHPIHKDIFTHYKQYSISRPVREGNDAMTDVKPPLPPFTRETAAEKVQAAEDAWNTCDPDKVAQAYTVDSLWRNRDTFVTGRNEIIAFLMQRWERELEYALRKNLWCFDENRIAVRFQYESHDRDGQWWRSYGNELWEFDEHGLMRRREASINDLRIDDGERRIFGPRTDEERGRESPIR